MSEYPHIKCKRILILANLDVGLYRFRKELIQALIADGNEVYISLPNGEYIDELKALGCSFIETPVDRRGINPFTDIRLFMSYSGLLRSLKPDFVITYTVKPNIYGGAACRIHKTQYAVNITGLGSAIESGGMLQKLLLVMYRFALKSAGTVFFENSGNRDTLVGTGVVPEGRDVVLPGAGVNTEAFRALPYPKNDSVSFLFVGRIMREKGIDELLYAAKKLKAEFGDRVTFDFVGFYEDEYKEEIDRLVKDNTLVFHGFCKDVSTFYEKANCVVLPSWHEGMSNVILEASASARPVITNDISGCREAVEDAKSGFLCIPRDRDSLVGKLREFMALTDSEREAMGKRAREIAENEFDKRKVIETTLREIKL